MSDTSTSNSAWKWWICGLLLLATTLNYMDRMALNQTAYRIQQYFQINNETYGRLEGQFSLAFAIGALVIGFWVDRANVRWIYPLMVVGWSICGFVTGFVESIAALFLCRFLLGLFEAGNWPCGVLTVRRVLKPEERSLGNAMFQSGTALGAIITPLIVLACLAYSDPQSNLRTSAQIVVGGGAEEVLPTPGTAWRLPFRVIGAVGLLWAILWLLTVRSRHVAPPVAKPGDPSDTRTFGEILQDRRYWLLLLMVLAVNTTWHSFRVWMPNYLRLEQGYSESAMQAFSSLYYLAADIGSITVGFATLWLARSRMTIHGSRMLAFAICSLMTLTSLTTRFESGWALRFCLLVVGFGSLGLFPLYFAFSQEISSRHQGKITGSLGCLNALYLWQLFPLQGRIVDQTKSYSLGLSIAGFIPIVAMLAFLALWPRSKTAEA
jgi:ACS family hexuronate transporter-like MFS transporter